MFPFDQSGVPCHSNKTLFSIEKKKKKKQHCINIPARECFMYVYKSHKSQHYAFGEHQSKLA